MEHNQQLIQIIHELNAKDAKQKSNSLNLKMKANSVRNLIEDVPSNDGDVLKTYLKKFKSFKAKIKDEAVTSSSEDEQLTSLLEEVSPREEEADFEKYSRKDSRVFTNKAKRSETQVTNLRWKQYSNSKATLTSDKNMAPLRLDKYST